MKLRTIISLMCSFVLAFTILSVPVNAIENTDEPEENEEIELLDDVSDDDVVENEAINGDTNDQLENQVKAAAVEDSIVLDRTEVVIDPICEYEYDYSYCNYYYDQETVQVETGAVESVTSLDDTIVTAAYNDYAKKIVITPHKGGTTFIEVMDAIGNKAEITVTVNTPPLELSRTSLTIGGSYDDYYYWSRYSYCYYDDYGDEVWTDERSYSPGYRILDSYATYESVYYDYPSYDDDTSFYSDDFYDEHYIYPTTGRIESVTSSNTKVITIGSDDSIYPVGAGTATIICTGSYGETAEVTVTVTKAFMNSYIKKKVTMADIKYGTTTITGSAPVGVTVNLKIGKKSYKATANSKGKYTISGLPIAKIGTNVYYSTSYRGGAVNLTKKIVKPGASISLSTVYRNTKKIKITITNVHKGDTVQLKVGKKKYNKTIKKDAKTYKYTVKVKKKKKEGTKITVTIKNKFKQTMTTKKAKVYYASKIKKGMTKKQCKLVPGWEYPDEVYVSGKYTTWWYDDDGDGFAIDSCLRFRKGKLIGWYY